MQTSPRIEGLKGARHFTFWEQVDVNFSIDNAHILRQYSNRVGLLGHQRQIAALPWVNTPNTKGLHNLHSLFFGRGTTK